MHCREERRQGWWGEMNNSIAPPQRALDSHPPPHKPRSQWTHSGLVVQLSQRCIFTGAALHNGKDHTGTSGPEVTAEEPPEFRGSHHDKLDKAAHIQTLNSGKA